MIPLILRFVAVLVILLANAADREQRRAEKALRKASELTDAAKVHRNAAQFARKAAAGLSDLAP